jgi:PAS domain S-box-containing protein
MGHPAYAALKVAIISPDAELRSGVSEILRERGHDVQGLGDAEALLATRLGDSVDLVVVGAGPRRADAVSLVQRLRADPDLAHLTILALLPQPDLHDSRAIWAAGADYVAAWPFHPELIDFRLWVLEQLAALKRACRRAESEARELHDILATAIADPVLLINERGVIVFANPAADAVFGYASGELVGRSLQVVVPEALRDSHVAGLRRYVESGRRALPSWTAVRLRGLRRDGHEFPVEVSFGEATLGGRRVFSGVLRDVSHRDGAMAPVDRPR